MTLSLETSINAEGSDLNLHQELTLLYCPFLSHPQLLLLLIVGGHKVISWTISGNYSVFLFIPMYIGGIHIINRVGFSPVNLSLLQGTLSQELRRVEGNLLFLFHRP